MASICMLLLCLCLMVHLFAAIAATELIKDPETMVSGNKKFKLGFFSPTNSKLRYLGICYNNVSDITFVWVANRNNPLNDSSGSLILSEDGNLQVLNGKKDSIWSSNVSQALANTSRTAQLLDTGNLCLLESDKEMTSGTKGTVIWQTFDHPTDVTLPSVELKITKSNMKKALQSWKSPSDPSYGRFSIGTDSFTHPQAIIWDGDRPHWRSGPWNGNIFLGVSYKGRDNYADIEIQQSSEDGAVVVFSGASKLAFSHYILSYDGTTSEIWWDSGERAWETVFRIPNNMCDFYGKCGEFSLCSPLKSPICQCLRGFTPKNAEEWNSGNWSSGCVRETPLQCGTVGKQHDGFLVLSRVKIPDLVEWLAGLSGGDCRTQCLENCSCLAYAYDVGAGCMYWSRNLIDIQELPSDGLDLYVRLPISKLGNKHKTKTDVIVAAEIVCTCFIVIFVCCFWRCKAWHKGTQFEEKTMPESSEREDTSTQGHVPELPLLKYEDLLVATNNFDESHKLGQGGFGQVYKGKMKDGQEIAVKRLSRTSRQGSQEFMNEVLVISKLQHRNLVRLVGFCTEGEEKMLVYEYMPNKSLDAFLFDPVKRELLNWEVRYNIIEGICRGLMYLHRDSRLRIIHRDLKASNILLDADLNPKISDFGMARIFSHNQDYDDTIRVAGTYGYMSPEYAMEGHFSEKSDVFSFGVLVLEIVTGYKNNNFVVEDYSVTLLGHVWKSWVENNITSIIDPIIANPGSGKDVERLIQVGLLCVQEYAKDRPSIATVLLMISSEIMELPCPKEPGFSKRLAALDSPTHALSYANNITITNMSANNVTITDTSGR